MLNSYRIMAGFMAIESVFTLSLIVRSEIYDCSKTLFRETKNIQTIEWLLELQNTAIPNNPNTHLVMKYGSTIIRAKAQTLRLYAQINPFSPNFKMNSVCVCVCVVDSRTI